jgi:DNA-binding transcriptional MerR regulator
VKRSADSYVELAKELGVSRQALHNWRHIEGAPEAQSNGQHVVKSWREFIAKHGLKSSEGMTTINDWKMRKVEHECEKLAILNAKLAGTLCEAAEVEAGISALLGAIRQAMNNLPARGAAKMLNISDHHEAEEILQEEVNVVLKTLLRGDFLKTLERKQPEQETESEQKPKRKKTLP